MKKLSFLLILLLSLEPATAKADFWGGDLPLLMEIVVNTLQQITQLKQIFGNGKDTLDMMRDLNKGVKDAMDIIRTMNTTLKPGVLGQLENVDQVLAAVERLYGKIPRSSEAPLQQTMDQSVAESISLHNEAFNYAAQVDPEAERIKEYAKIVSPQGAGKLTAESLGVLINVLNQVLRTNAAILKVQSEQLALMNRKEKLNSEQFRVQYEGLAQAFEKLKPQYSLPSISK